MTQHDDTFIEIKELLHEQWRDGFAAGIVLGAVIVIVVALLASRVSL